jgi:DNA-binding NarL/FixJ family response regulator
MRILLIDDHTLFREAISHVLAGLDANPAIVEAATAEDAIRLLKHYRDIDLILLDLSMPGMGGLSGVPKLAELAPTVPIVIVSASEDVGDVQKAIQGGAAGYIPKTASAHELTAALRLVMGGEIYLPPTLLAQLDATAAQPAERGHRHGSELTPRQTEVLRLMGDGQSNKVIARHLGLTEGTVKLHVYAILRALGSRNRTEAVVEAVHRGLITTKR